MNVLLDGRQEHVADAMQIKHGLSTPEVGTHLCYLMENGLVSRYW